MLKVRKHKFNAKRTEKDGIKFSSKLEASFYSKLKLLQAAGEVLFFLRQLPFHLPGNTRYVLDYAVFYSNGDIEWIDVKGLSTPMFILKKKQVEDLYPIEIKVISK
jgi:hypothetical protein